MIQGRNIVHIHHFEQCGRISRFAVDLDGLNCNTSCFEHWRWISGEKNRRGKPTRNMACIQNLKDFKTAAATGA